MPRLVKHRTLLAKFMTANDIPIDALNEICGRTFAWLIRSGRSRMTDETAAAVAAIFGRRLDRVVDVGEILDAATIDPQRALRRLRSRRRQRVQAGSTNVDATA